MMKKIIILGLILSLFSNVALAQESSQLIPPICQPVQLMPAANLLTQDTIFNQSTYHYDAIDPVSSTNAKGANYPGLRGANQLVIYTPSFGYRTNTNEFGTEAIVRNGIVTSLSGADSLIPSDGFVISGHGLAKKWINQNVLLGAKITIDTDNRSITSYITSDTFMFAARTRIKEVEDMINYYKANSLNYNPQRAESYLDRAKDNLAKAQKYSDDSQKYSNKAIEYADTALTYVIPYSQNELKGVWIRPTYYNKEDIIAVLDNLQKDGINNIFIETYYHGKTIFPSRTMARYGFIEQYEDYQGFDPLKIWITEAHKRKMKVNIWFQTFYVGNQTPSTNPKYILSVRPEWSNVQKKDVNSGTMSYSVSEHNGYFLDPANNDVQTFLYDLINELVFRYRPDGINLDYIRYPQTVSSRFANQDISSWGYTNAARTEFMQLYGIDPYELKNTDPMWNCWKYYRADKVTNFVRKVAYLCRANNINLTTVIFPNKSAAMDTKLQDWKTWSYNNLVDGFTPLILTCDDKTAENLIEEVLKNKTIRTKLYGGLFVTFMNGSNADLIKQIHVTRKNGLDGIIFFDYAHLGEKYTSMLTESICQPTKQQKFVRDVNAPDFNKFDTVITDKNQKQLKSNTTEETKNGRKFWTYK